MTREEMMLVLKNAPTAVELTALTTEETLECTYITSKGIGYEWRSMFDWPVALLKLNGDEKLCAIIDKANQSILSFDDVQNTDLYNFYLSENEDDSNVEALNNFFEHIKYLSLCENGEIYAYALEGKAYFFETYEKFKQSFSDNFAKCDITWEEMADTNLMEWYERISTEEFEIPLIEYTEEQN